MGTEPGFSLDLKRPAPETGLRPHLHHLHPHLHPQLMSLAATRQENVSLISCFGDMTISQRTRVSLCYALSEGTAQSTELAGRAAKRDETLVCPSTWQSRPPDAQFAVRKHHEAARKGFESFPLSHRLNAAHEGIGAGITQPHK